jgi:hypothetical protein
MLEATITPLSTLPTAHPSPEALRLLGAAVRRSTPRVVLGARPVDLGDVLLRPGLELPEHAAE